MNYTEPHAYMKPPAMRPLDMYAVKARLADNLALTGESLVSLGQVGNDHALRIDELRQDLENLRALMMWIADAHPDVIKQYYAIKDIERASK